MRLVLGRALKLLIKTIKLKSTEYFTLDTVEPLPYFLVGGRGTGKSYLVKNYIKDMLLRSEFNDRYMYVRVSNNETKTHDSWLQESGICDEVPFDGENVRIVRGKPYGGAVSLAYELAGSTEYKHIGYVATLESSALLKSGFYGDVQCIVFEEFIRRGMSGRAIEEYCFNFAELIETVLRGRKVPIFFIANTLNAYNPLLTMFKDYNLYRIFSEQRRDNISNERIAKYLQGELYQDEKPLLEDFDYLFTIKTDRGYLSFYSDRFRHRDIYVTSKNSSLRERPDLLFVMQREFLYNFSALAFYFDTERTEVFFYSETNMIKTKIRNKLTSMFNL